jgi:long-chain acyl-CoA synthetase
MTFKTVPQVFKQAVQNYGDRVAMRKKEYGLWHDISWNEYYRLAQYVGLALISIGLERADKVSICWYLFYQRLATGGVCD